MKTLLLLLISRRRLIVTKSTTAMCALATAPKESTSLGFKLRKVASMEKPSSILRISMKIKLLLAWLTLLITGSLLTPSNTMVKK